MLKYRTIQRTLTHQPYECLNLNLEIVRTIKQDLKFVRIDKLPTLDTMTVLEAMIRF